ncbi:hypothetical protein PoB_002312400, partial [Plakobranchus ocellatus]
MRSTLLQTVLGKVEFTLWDHHSASIKSQESFLVISQPLNLIGHTEPSPRALEPITISLKENLDALRYGTIREIWESAQFNPYETPSMS